MGIFDWLFGKKKDEEKRPSKIAISETNEVKKKSKKRSQKPKKTDKSTENNAFQKKLTSWGDVDVPLMALSAEYRIKVIKEVMKIENVAPDSYYQMQQDLRRIANIYRGNEDGMYRKKQLDEIINEYERSKYKTTETDTKHWTIRMEIEKEKDPVKQNILIDNELAKDPNNFNLYNDKAYNLYEIGKIKEGISEVLKAIKMNPNLAGFYDTAGEGYCMLEEYENAIEIMSKGIIIAPDGMCPDGKEYRIEEHYYNRGMTYLKLKEYEKAKKDFIRTLAIDVGFKKAMYALKEIPGYIDE